MAITIISQNIKKKLPLNTQKVLSSVTNKFLINQAEHQEISSNNCTDREEKLINLIKFRIKI